MEIKSRPYRSIQDFLGMTSILALGRKTSPSTYYVHIGDLSWWLFYGEAGLDQWAERIRIWERDGHLCGWSLVDPDWSSFDLYLHPDICGTKQAIDMLDATIEWAAEILERKNRKQIYTVWVSERDHNLRETLLERGFIAAESFMWYLERPLHLPVPPLTLPNGFGVRAVQGEGEVMKRAAASHSAFQSRKNFTEYWPRYQRFMRSPVYNPEFDLVAVAPDGQFASFCIIWPDPVNHIGLFEPVGAQTAFQGQGLGKAIVLAGLAKMQAMGMEKAMVCVEHDNAAAVMLYQSVGFEKKFKLHTYGRLVQS